LSSFRRLLLDQCLEQNSFLLKGKVLDLGGKKIGKRGTFVPPLDQVTNWEYLNTDNETKPDYCCTAEDIPLEDASIDIVIMTEMLEYLPDPDKVFFEVYRILSEDGHVLLSTPFLNPLHGDYWADRARYTPVMLKEMTEKAGFTLKYLEPMGSVGSVVYDILRISFGYADERNALRYLGAILPKFLFFFSWMDRKMVSQKKFINTGYFLVLKK
jgi:SAM-dependent methyltransferase